MFFTVENILFVLMKVFIIMSDSKQNKTYVVSLRAAALIYLLGLTAILCGLGLLSVWLIFYFFIVSALELNMLLQSLNMRNAPSYGYQAMRTNNFGGDNNYAAVQVVG